MKNHILAALLFSGCVCLAFSQGVQLKYNGSGSYVYIERTDLRRYDNGTYVGLVSREVRSFIAPVPVPAGGNPSDRYYDGSFFVDEATKRNSLGVKAALNGSVPSRFRISAEGQLVMIEDNGYPTFRSFPSYTAHRISIGDRWQAKAERTVDPLNKGVFTKMPMLVEYTYLRDETYNGEDVYVFSAQWATRYGISYRDFGGDKDLQSAQGSHKATMYVSKRTGNALVVRDMVDETFLYNDGSRFAFKGTISLFTEYPPAYDRSKILPALQRIASVSAEELKEIIEKPADKASGSGGNSARKESASSAEKNSQKNPGKSSVREKAEEPSSAGKNQQKKNSSSRLEKAKETVSSSGSKVTVENTEAGIRLTMQNLNFKPDSAELLPGENKRLDQIADVLKEVPDQLFLVEGHTADVGYKAGEMKLSIERANAIADALAARGIPRDKFICKGSGGTKPVADNATPEGKAKNRRVEITILE